MSLGAASCGCDALSGAPFHQPHMLSTAVSYALAGRYVFPLVPRTKSPYAGSHGHLDASKDPEQVARWWRQRPNANIGVSCAASGLVVVDLDPRNGAEMTVDALIDRHGAFPETETVLSGGLDGGTQLYYAAPTDLRLPPSLGPGVDLKYRGFVCAPPSVHPSGRRYMHEASAAFGEIDVAPCPAWILALGRSRSVERRAATGAVTDSFLFAALQADGRIGTTLANGSVCVVCPMGSMHGDGRGLGRDSSCVLLAPTGRLRLGGFRCSHQSHGPVDIWSFLSTKAMNVAGAKYPEAHRFVMGKVQP